MNVDVNIKVIKDVGWSFMYLNPTTSKGTKNNLMMIPHKKLWGISTQKWVRLFNTKFL
jgi:hypothetical protein